MKQVLRLPFLALALCLLASAAGRVSAQTPTPDPFVTQISNSAGDTFARDISGDGRFVVIESSGDIATAAPAGQTVPGNADGNREIFLFDFAQRRIFQITDTTSLLVDATKTGTARFVRENTAVEISNNRPAISRDGKWIVFSSNAFDPADGASTPFSFKADAADAALAARLKADANQELFLYRIPDVAEASLTSGDLPEFTNLRRNTFTRATNTAASRAPHAGTTTAAPFVADDNRDASINDDGSRVAFVSTRNLSSVNLGAANADGSPEVYVYNNSGSGSYSQLTVTSLDQNLFVFTDNPNISGATAGASVVAFVSNATDLRTAAGTSAVNAASGNADGDTEIFVATYNGTTATSMKQATLTKRKVAADTVNFLNPGRRISRDGSLVAFESVAANPKGDDSTTNESNRAIFVYNVAADTFVQVGPRAVSTGTDAEFEDILRFPTFGRADNTRIYFTSDLNLKSDGTRVAAGEATGLNPSRIKQIFSATVPASSSAATVVTRLTNLTGGDPGTTMEPFVSDTQERISFSLANFEFGTGNPDRANEAYYLITPPAPLASDAPAASSALQFLTGASRREVATPAASPSPVPTPAPGVVTGLAPGMIGFVRTTSTSPATLAPSEKRVCPADNPGCDAASESQHRPTLPVELNGVSVSVNGAAAGLYFVSPAEIQFVVPPGLTAQTAAATYPVVITVRSGATVRTVRTVLQVVAAQPDIFTSTNGAGGRAVVTNVTNPLLSTGTPEPFTVTTTYINSAGASTTEATKLRLVLTGVRGIARGTITVRLTKSDNTTVDITGDQIPTDPIATDMPGVFTLDFRLPATLAGAGDVGVTVIVNTGTATFTSRLADTAPRFRIN